MNLELVAPCFLMGVFGSAHCVAMCGGIAGSLSCAASSECARPRRSLALALSYNLGRVASYAAAGAFAGSVGVMVSAVFDLHALQAGLRLVAGVATLGVALFVAGLFPAFAAVERLGGPLWSIVGPIARRLLPVRTAGQAVLLGGLWGFLPCGMVYAALAIALGAGSASGGGLAMAAFGIGTLPAMVATSLVAGAVMNVARRSWVRKVAAVGLACFGILGIAMAAAQIASLRAGDHGAATCCHRPQRT